jgi:hypothetical protein
MWIPRIIKGKSRIIRAAANWERPFIAFIHAVVNGALSKGKLR